MRFQQKEGRQPAVLKARLVRFVVLVLLPALLLYGCNQPSVIGMIDQQASIALMRFEALPDGISGVVYRRINDFDAFVATSETPVLVAFYAPNDPVNTLLIPKLEQMADDDQDQLQIVWIEAASHEQISSAFGVQALPHFTVVVSATLKRSLVGFAEEGGKLLEELVEPYLNEEDRYGNTA